MEDLKQYLHSSPAIHGVARSADGQLREFHRKGVVDLYDLITNEPSFLAGGQLADRIIGRGAALLAVKGGVACVHADLISEPALEVLTNALVPLSYDRLVPHIINWTGDGMCLVEALTLDTNDLDEAYRRIGEFLQPRRATL
jgi:hypothetical protein